MNSDEAKRELGRYIRAQRKYTGLTLEEAAHRAGLDFNNLSRVERGEQLPKSTTLFKLAMVIPLNLNYLAKNYIHYIDMNE
ncbi:helix-turn-helix domain-containing protein [Radiobacillus sp. PE A8.2]|uniref:helix-turn-helix domain-containing protein n=1 Tax=Radiobacillus sp. PE A8.2 TaxID=3380349 RepID=UPI003890E89A